jgi:hypothetical protein
MKPMISTHLAKGLAVALLLVAEAATIPAKADKLNNQKSGYCLDSDGRAENGGVAQMWQCVTHPKQTWTFRGVGSDAFQLINQASNYCLDTDGRPENGTKVRMWQCAAHPNQQWIIRSLDRSNIQLINRSSNFCLDTDNGSGVDGGVVRMWQCAAHPNQTWNKLRQVGPSQIIDNNP